jgi:putative nucleotidyltransferase with HDIG domain
MKNVDMHSDSSIFQTLFRYTQALSVALGYRDTSTQLHSERVLGLSLELAIKYGLNEDDLDILRIAASFHDIGKIGIPDPVLLKDGSYDEKDWTVMREHPKIGADILRAIDFESAKMAADVIHSHHEHFDGSGYPEGKSKQDISILARIISVADAYDAMAMTRSYHQAKPHDQIMDIIHQETGNKFDPDIVAVFADIIEISEYKSSV